MRLCSLIIATILSVAPFANSFAQISGLGVYPQGIFQHGDVDNVNLESGNVAISIPLVSYPRQLGEVQPAAFRVIANTNVWAPYFGPDGVTPVTGFYTAYTPNVPMSLGPMVIDSYTTYSWYSDEYYLDGYGNQHLTEHLEAQDADGATHPLVVDAASVALPHTVSDSYYRSVDGTGYALPPTDYMRDPRGAYFGSDLEGNTPINPAGTPPPPSLRYYSDFSSYSTPSSRCPTTLQDGTGAYDTQPLITSQDWTLPNASGGSKTYTFCYAAVYVRTDMWGNSGSGEETTYCDDDDEGGGCSGVSWVENSSPWVLIQSIVMPDGTYWGFRYDSASRNQVDYLYPGYSPIACPNGSALGVVTSGVHACGWGVITKILEPTGGSISYTYELQTVRNYSADGAAPGLPVLIKRTLSTDQNGQDAYGNDRAGITSTWTYDLNEDLFPPHPGVSVVDPEGHCMNLKTSYVVGPPFVSTKSQVWYDNTSGTCSGTAKKRIDTDYTDVYGPEPNMYPGSPSIIGEQINSVVTTVDGVAVSRQDPLYYGYFGGTQTQGQLNTTTGLYTWDNGYGSVTLHLAMPSGTITRDPATGSVISWNNTTYESDINSSYWNSNMLTYPAYTTSTPDGSTVLAETDYGYDSSHPWRMTSKTDKYIGDATQDATTTMTWNSNGTLASTTDPGGHTTSYIYDSSHPELLTEVDHPTTSTSFASSNPAVAHKEYFQFDPNSQLIQYTVNMNGTGISDSTHRTHYIYNSADELTEITSPAGGDVQYGYTYATSSTSSTVVNGRLTTTVSAYPDPSRVTTAEFDGLGRAVRSFMVNGQTGSTAYDQSDTCYDPMGQVAFATYTYQGGGPTGTGRVCSGTGLLAGDSYAYDSIGRTTQVTHSDSTYATTEYAGFDTRTTSEGHPNASGTTIYPQKVTEVDAAGRLAKVCEVSGSTLNGVSASSCGLSGFSETGFLTTYDYDTLNNLTAVHQSGLQDRTFSYDSMSRVTSAFNPEAGTIGYTYNKDGLVTARVTPKANLTSGTSTTTTNYYYDQLHRLFETTYDDGVTPMTASIYDTMSGWTGMSNTNGQKVGDYIIPSWSDGWENLYLFYTGFDAAGRSTTAWRCDILSCSNSYTDQPTTYSFDQYSYAYNGAGDLSSAGDSLGGHSVAWTRNSGGKVSTGVIDSSYTYFSSPNYSPGGLADAALGNGKHLCSSYDSRDRLSSNSAGTGSSCTSSQFTLGLSYAPDGSVSSATDSILGGGWSYGYDEFNRVTKASQTSGATLTWSYDRYGNRLTQGASGSGLSVTTSSYTFSTSSGSNRNSNFCYDPAGNILDLSTCPSSDVHQFSYDADHRIISPDYGNTIYLYDVDGRRIEKTDTSFDLNNAYIYDPEGHKWLGIDNSAWIVDGYVGGEIVATYRSSSNVYYPYTDHLGTKRVQTDGSGAVDGSWTSLPFGDALHCTLMSCNDAEGNHFTSQFNDTESGLDYFNARYYYSTSGRFLSPDPSGLVFGDPSNPQSLNLYSYVLNNPLSATDPSGMERCVASTGQDINVVPELCANAGGSLYEYGLSNPEPDGYDEKGNAKYKSKGYWYPVGDDSNAVSASFQAGAPKKPTPWYKNSCIVRALGTGVLNISIDSIGLIPEAEGVTKVFENTVGYQIARRAGNAAGYRGIVATRYGAKAVAQGKGALGAIGGAFGLSDASPQGRISTALTVVGFVPGLGTLAAGASIVNDLIHTGRDIAECR